MARRVTLPLVAAAVLFVCLHALTVPRTFEDEDSVNLAFGVDSFDVRHYAPHPPGYPVYIALGKISAAVVGWLQPDWPRMRTVATGLAWISIISGALGIFAVAALWRVLGVSPGWSVLAAIVTAASPLYWFTAARPLTDMPGLAAALAVQAALVRGLRGVNGDRLPIALIAGSLGAGLAIGLRSQTFYLTMPALGWALMALARRRRWRHAVLLAGLTSAGVLVWFIPLIQLSGGLAEYRDAATGLVRLDLAGVRMLATHPSWPVLREGLEQTFLTPWRLPGMPWVVMAAAAVGLARLCAGRPERALAIAVVSVPYLAAHLLFHEVETTRYALPVAAMVAGLACLGLGIAGRRAGPAAAVAAAAAMTVTTHPVTGEYARGWPVFQVIADMRAERQQSIERPILAAHQGAWGAASRALDWFRGRWDVDPPPLITRGETARLVRYWESGGTDPIWMLTDPRRRDMSRFDPQAGVNRGTRYLSARVAMLVGGRREYNVGWWRLSPPSWMLGSGWAVTGELAREDADPRVAEAFIRRRGGATVALVGAKHLDERGAAAEVVATLDGREVDRWPLPAGRRRARWIDLPAGALAGDGPYARLRLTTAARPDGGRLVAFDQFDASNGQRPMIAFGKGWSALRGDPAAGLEWRRASRLAEIEVRHAGRPVRLRLRGSVPEEFEMAPMLAISAGTSLVTTVVPDRRFEIAVRLTPAQLDAAAGIVILEADLRRTPREHRRLVPPRQFGVRITAVQADDDDL